MNCASFMAYGNMRNHGFLIVLFTRAIRGVRYSVGCPLSTRSEFMAYLCSSDPRDQTSHPPTIEARTGLADYGRVESANDSIAFKSVGFDYRVNV